MLIGFDLLDRQIVDRDGMPVGKVDDVELVPTDDGGCQVSALLTGGQALGARLGGALGRLLAAGSVRLDPRGEGHRRIPWDLVADVDSAVRLSVRRDLLPEPSLEGWLDNRLIGRIPGAGDAG